MVSAQEGEERVVVDCGSSRMSVAPSEVEGAGLMSVQLTPPSFDSHRPNAEWIGGETRRSPPPPRRTAAYRWSALVGATARRGMERPREKSPRTCEPEE